MLKIDRREVRYDDFPLVIQGTCRAKIFRYIHVKRIVSANIVRLGKAVGFTPSDVSVRENHVTG